MKRQIGMVCTKRSCILISIKDWIDLRVLFKYKRLHTTTQYELIRIKEKEKIGYQKNTSG